MVFLRSVSYMLTTVNSKKHNLNLTYHQSETQLRAQNDFRTSSLCSFGPIPLLKSYS